MKYLITYMGDRTGSFMGRDDGYPELKTVLVENDADLLKYKGKDIKYYLLSPVDVTNIIQKEVRKQREELERRQKRKEEALSKLSLQERKLLGL